MKMRKNVCIYFCEPHLHDKLRLSMPDKRFRSAVPTTCTMASFQITEMALKILTVKAIRQIFSVLWLLLYYTCLVLFFKGTISFVSAWTLFSTCIPPHVIKQPPSTLHKLVYSIEMLHIERCQNWKKLKMSMSELYLAFSEWIWCRVKSEESARANHERKRACFVPHPRKHSALLPKLYMNPAPFHYSKPLICWAESWNTSKSTSSRPAAIKCCAALSLQIL